MEQLYKEKIGSLRISEDVIVSIVRQAALEVPGVAAVALSSSALRSALRRSVRKPIALTVKEDMAVIDLYVTVTYGSRIVEVAEKVQDGVKNAVQSMTSLTVSRVNVFVTGVAAGAADC